MREALKGQEFAGDYRLRLHGHRTTLMDIPVGERVIFAMRDPVSRFESAFRSRQRQGRPRYNVPWTTVEAEVFGTFADANALAVALGEPGTVAGELARRAMSEVGHFRPVTNWLGSEHDLARRGDDIFFVLKQWTLDADFAELTASLGLDTKLPQGDTDAHRSPESGGTTIGPIGLAHLREWYSEDYRILHALTE
ncbi:hypothetical protein [Demequina mangrovi]|uniref:hypothetical protein n=1 Tax=Demequina mangrovi TaxID=1043493 RepID=UPI0005A645D6|nr:hypothetical protein [Demequina mangrovi]